MPAFTFISIYNQDLILGIIKANVFWEVRYEDLNCDVKTS